MGNWLDDQEELEMQEMQEMQDEYENNLPDIQVGKAYRTLDGEKAFVMYISQTPYPEVIYFGHVYIQNKPVAVQWDHKGKADPSLHDKGFDVVGLWGSTQSYIRYIYIYRDGMDLRTEVYDQPKQITNLVASARVKLMNGCERF